MFRAAIVFLGLVGAASAGQFLKKERELSVEEQLAQLRKENADMRASLETYRLAVEKVSEDDVTWRPTSFPAASSTLHKAPCLTAGRMREPLCIRVNMPFAPPRAGGGAESAVTACAECH